MTEEVAKRNQDARIATDLDDALGDAICTPQGACTVRCPSDIVVWSIAHTSLLRKSWRRCPLERLPGLLRTHLCYWSPKKSAIVCRGDQRSDYHQQDPDACQSEKANNEIRSHDRDCERPVCTKQDCHNADDANTDHHQVRHHPRIAVRVGFVLGLKCRNVDSKRSDRDQ